MNVYRKRRGAWNGEIGPVLAEARRSKGLSLKEAERYTRIRARYLEGLEHEDPAELPDKGYVQSFLGSYAEFLGLDAEELGRRFKKYTGGRRLRRETAGNPSAKSRASRSGWRRLGAGTLLALSLTILALVAALYLFGREAPPTESPEVPVEEAGDGPVEPVPDERGNESGGPGGGDEPAPLDSVDPDTGGPGEDLEVRVLVRGAESWLSVESDSGAEYTGMAQPGFSRSFESEGSLRITTGNAGAVLLEINGQEYGELGEDGEVTSRSFTLKRGR